MRNTRLLDLIYYGCLLFALLYIGLGIAACAWGDDPGPTPQLVLDCRVIDVYDGDTATVEVIIRSRVRLRRCWAPEISGRGVTAAERTRGLASRDHLREIVGPLPAPALLVVPLDDADALGDLLSFDRVLGDLYVGDGPQRRSLADIQVTSGHATRTRKK